MKKKINRFLLIIAGYAALTAGVVGIFVPLLPTTPFLLLAVICFSHSSKKLYDWVMEHRLFGNYIRCYHQFRAVSKKTKILALVFLWVTITWSVVFVVSYLWVRILLLVIAACVTIHLVRLRTVTREMIEKVK